MAMSGKQPAALLLWDCSSCPAQNVDFVQQLSRALKLSSLNIIVNANDQANIPPTVSDLSIAYPVTCRFGPNAVYDTVVDVVSFLTKCKCNCTLILISTSFPIWINLFQRCPPRIIVFISSRDPRASLDFSFLPPSIGINILKWPNLESLSTIEAQPVEIEEQIEPVNNKTSKSSQRSEKTNSPNIIEETSNANHNDSNNDEEDEDEDEALNKYINNEIDHEDDALDDDEIANMAEDAASNSLIAEEEDEEEEADQQLPNNDGGHRGFNKASTIQPLANIDKYNIDLRSPVPTTPSRVANNNSSELSPLNSDTKQTSSNASSGYKPHPNANSGQTMNIPAKFQPLIEAMRAIGKAMISLSDLEGQLKNWGNKLNEPIENTNTYIAKASDAGIIIYDKSINYVRFRNRQMSSANIEYI